MNRPPAEAPRGATPDPAQSAAPGDRPGMPQGPERDELVRQVAYRLFEERGGLAGQETDDWFAAEVIVDAQYAARVVAPTGDTPPPPPVTEAAAPDETPVEPPAASGEPPVEPPAASGERFEIPVEGAAVEPVAAADASRGAEAAPKPAPKQDTTPPSPAATSVTAGSSTLTPAMENAPKSAARSTPKSAPKSTPKSAAKSAPKTAPSVASAAARPRKTKP